MYLGDADVGDEDGGVVRRLHPGSEGADPQADWLVLAALGAEKLCSNSALARRSIYTSLVKTRCASPLTILASWIFRAMAWPDNAVAFARAIPGVSLA